MGNYVGVFKMKLTKGHGPKVADLLRQVSDINMLGNIKYNMAVSGDIICGYEEWESKEAHAASMQIPEVTALIKQVFPHMDGKPEMIFEGESL